MVWRTRRLEARRKTQAALLASLNANDESIHKLQFKNIQNAFTMSAVTHEIDTYSSWKNSWDVLWHRIDRCSAPPERMSMHMWSCTGETL